MTMTVKQIQDDFNWQEAFGFAPDVVTIDDVVEVVASVDGENDEANWVGIFLLKSGKYLYLSAWCDYTGWDCRAGGDGSIHPTAAHAIQWGCTQEDRDRLGVAIDPATMTDREVGR